MPTTKSKRTKKPVPPVRLIPLDEIEGWADNPRNHDLNAIGSSMKRFGYVEFVATDSTTGKLVAGHGRVEELRQLRDSGAEPPEDVHVVKGAWHLWVREKEFVDEKEARAYVVASNRTHDLGEAPADEMGRWLMTLNVEADDDLVRALAYDEDEFAAIIASAEEDASNAFALASGPASGGSVSVGGYTRSAASDGPDGQPGSPPTQAPTRVIPDVEIAPEILVGNALHVLPTLDAGKAQCCVTSPPYWGLRDYGDPGQDWPAVEFKIALGGAEMDVNVPAMTAPLGLEATPIAFVGHLVAIFREVKRVLADDGVMWVNIGDTYASSSKGGAPGSLKQASVTGSSFNSPRFDSGMPDKNLVGVPWLLAYALRSDGWYLRSDVIWHKKNPMPEPVTDRPSKGHEYVFLLAKSDRYFYDVESLREPYARDYKPGPGFGGLGNRSSGYTSDLTDENPTLNRTGQGSDSQPSEDGKRNARTVWSISTHGYPGAHHAVMSPELARRCVVSASRPDDVVLDPFAGAATTGKVAFENQRRFIGIELMEDNAKLATERISGLRPNELQAE